MYSMDLCAVQYESGGSVYRHNNPSRRLVTAMKFFAFVFLFVFAIFPSDARLQGCAQSPPTSAPMTVSAEWLKSNISDPKLVLLHVGAKPEYEAGHIPGASYIEMSNISLPPAGPDSLSLELPTAEQVKPALEKLGISNDSRIVIYWGKDWTSPTTRVYFTLDAFGLSGNASVLDGGMPAWVAAGGTLTKDVPTPKPGSVRVKLNEKVVAKADWLKANIKNDKVRVIDARNTQFYDGTSAGSMPRAGHVAGAKNIPFDTFTENGKFKDDAAMRKMFEAAGVKPYDDVVTYCHIGQQGTVPYFVAKKLGYKVALYDGSFQEWSRIPDAPVTNPAGDRAAPTVSLVTPQWVEQHAADANVRIIDVRQNVYDYFAGHAPNAVHLADSAMRFPFEGYPTQYPEPFLVSRIFSNAGVEKGKKVVLYSDGDGILGATMLAYLLERVGHSDISIVDGGWGDYKAEQKTAQEYPVYKAVPYDMLDNRSGRATLDDVKAAIGKDTVKFIDARPPEVYRGEVKTWVRNGHIPGAYSVPWKQLVEPNNTHKLKPLADLKAVYAAKGFKESDDIIVYCGTSREASIEYLVLKHLLKFQKVRLYEGSWAEYSNHADLRNETGAGR